MERNNESKEGGNGMAVTQVTATMDNETINLVESDSGVYTASVVASNTAGTHDITISAYNDSGEVSIMTTSLSVVSKQSKTNWKPTDRFNYVDYNRIKNNLYYLWQRACQYWGYFEIQDMGSDMDDYTGYWDVEVFNAWEYNLDEINKHMLSTDYGIKQTFFENGPFIKWDELNRIESATLDMNNMLDRLEVGLRRLPFRLGTFKEVKI